MWRLWWYCAADREGSRMAQCARWGKPRTALAIDCDPLSCATHELSHPHTPVVKYEMGEWKDTRTLIYRYVPKVLMSKTCVHVSNSCRQAATGNITFRDLNKAQGDTDWYLLSTVSENTLHRVDARKCAKSPKEVRRGLSNPTRIPNEWVL